MERARRWIGERIDRWQSSRRWLAVVVGLIRKRDDDRAGYLGALLGHYLFVSALPLLASLLWILGRVTAHDLSLRRRATDALAGALPVIGDQLRHGTLRGSSLGIVALVAFSLVAGLAVLVVAQDASGTAWGVPRRRRPRGVAARARSLALAACLGVAVVGWTLVAGLISGLATVALVGRALTVVVGLVLLSGAVTCVFAALSPGQLERVRDHWPGALVAAVGWTVLQEVASAFIAHQASHWGPVYGTFASVVALLAWLALVGHVAITGIEFNVVLRRQLYPRAVVGPPTDADRRALGLAADAVDLDADAPGGNRRDRIE